MEHLLQLIIAILAGGLVTGIAAAVAIFYTFNGRLVKVETELEALKKVTNEHYPALDSKLNRIDSQLELIKNALSHQYLHLQGVPTPAPTLGKPVGGANAILDTFKAVPYEIQETEISLVFDRVTDRKALVNLVSDGRIGIKNIKLESLNQEEKGNTSGANYTAIISMENLTDENIDFVIPKGQVFENQETESGRQNLVAAQNWQKGLSPRASCDLKVEAHCMNQNLNPPDGNLGNITIFKIKDDEFDGQKEVWESINNSVNKAKLIIEGRKKN